MADHPDVVEGRTLRAHLELQLDRQPISGWLRTPAGAEERFEGWLGFADALRRLHERQPRHPPIRDQRLENP